jgi:hypothetical protein
VRASAGLPCVIDAVDGENVLGEIDADEDNAHGLPLLSELMDKTHFPSWHSLPIAATRLAQDGEVPFIRSARATATAVRK